PRNTYWLYSPTLPVNVQSGSGAAAGAGACASAPPADSAANAAAAAVLRRRSFWFMSESSLIGNETKICRTPSAFRVPLHKNIINQCIAFNFTDVPPRLRNRLHRFGARFRGDRTT